MITELKRLDCIGCGNTFWSEDDITICGNCLPEPDFDYPQDHLIIMRAVKNGQHITQAIENRLHNKKVFH